MSKTRIEELLRTNPVDLNRMMPADSFIPFNQWPWEKQRERIESINPTRRMKPVDVRKVPGLEQSGVQLDPNRQKVCPTCFMILQKRTLRSRFEGRCPRDGTMLSI